MKRLFFLVTVASILFAQNLFAEKSVWDGVTSDVSWYNPDETEFNITSAAQLKGLQELVDVDFVTFEGKTVYLTCDIDLNNYPWTPIGLQFGQQFSGVFNGLKHSITNVHIDSGNLDYTGDADNIGLFGSANEIYNLRVKGSVEVSLGRYVGGLAGIVNHMENISSDFTVKVKSSLSSCNIGTVAGSAEDAVTVEATGSIVCGNNASLRDRCFLGGIAGFCSNMAECASAVDVNIKRYGATSDIRIGGVSGMSVYVQNILFTGSLYIENIECPNSDFDPKTGGICGALTEGFCLLSVPKSMEYGSGMPSGQSALVPASSEDAIVDYGYYLSTWASKGESFGTPISTGDIQTGNPLTGFETEVWAFSTEEAPAILALQSLVPEDIYTVTYYVDNELYIVYEYKNGESVTPATTPVKEGYTFTGWDNVPSVIEGDNYVVHGSFKVNSYTVTYVVGGVDYATESVEYHAVINPPVLPYRKGLVFAWTNLPETMPASDVTVKGDYLEDSYECVDLGLPSGLMWATKNVGAVSAADYGIYFAWGEVQPKASYTKDSYKGPADGTEQLAEANDAAIACWGSPWRVPTLAEAQELVNKCTWENDNVNGVYGHRIIGPNGNSIFLPSAGIKQDKSVVFKYRDSYIMTSSSLSGGSLASVLYCDGSNFYSSNDWDRCWGYSVRPVADYDPNGIHDAISDMASEVKGIYDIQGHKIDGLKKGVNIIRYSNGSARKVMIR